MEEILPIGFYSQNVEPTILHKIAFQFIRPNGLSTSLFESLKVRMQNHVVGIFQELTVDLSGTILNLLFSVGSGCLSHFN